MGHIACQLFGIIRRRRIGEGERRQRPDQAIPIAIADQSLCFGVGCFWIEGGFWNDFNRCERIIALKYPQARKIRDCPYRQGLKSYKLTLIMGIAVTCWITWFGWSLELNESAGRLTGAFQSNVGPSHARRGELGNDNKLVCGNLGEQGFEKALERWSESLFEIARPRPAQLPNAERIVND
ncbi:MAG: hypothetical protein L0Y50_02010 [Beijerinckiaceae bacterium]|nr:hypothetical protein [Beijerinckiaceae bacterium]